MESLLFLTFVLGSRFVFSQDHLCDSSYSCDSDSGSYYSVRCRGYFSCYQTSLSASNYVYSTGAFGAYEASSLSQTGGSQIDCAALSSCSRIQNLNLLGFQKMECGGELSCARSTITTSGSFNCFGLRSCSYSNISSGYFYGYGVLDLHDSVLSTERDIYLSGTFAGYGATIICTDSSCNLDCASATACNNMKLECDTVADTSCFSISSCGKAMKSDACPSGFEMSGPFELPNLANIDFSTLANAQDVCDHSNGLNCDGYQNQNDGCYNSDLTTSAGPICCTGEGSCEYATSITAFVNYTDDIAFESQVAFRSDGMHSSRQVSGPIKAPNGGHMYFTGYEAYDGSSSIVAGNGEFDVIASGYQVMKSAEISMIRNLYCLAYYACSSATVSNIFGDIYGYSYYGLGFATITNVVGDIYCAGFESCYRTEADGVGGNIIGVGEVIMRQAKWFNVNGTVVAYGYQALMSATLTNVTNILASGEESLRSADIDSVANLDVSGTNALRGANINSNGVDGYEMVLQINDDNSYAFNVYCSETDTCQISCQSSGACTLMNLHCFGTCYVECDGVSSEIDGIDCPANNVSGTQWNLLTTNIPSKMPSNDPTMIPTESTFEPSQIPSQFPSDEPSTNPTDIPSAEPSNLPSNLPTEDPTAIPSDTPSEIPTEEPIAEETTAFIDDEMPNVLSTNTRSDTASSINNNGDDDSISLDVVIGVGVGVFVLGFGLAYCIFGRKKNSEASGKNKVNIALESVAMKDTKIKSLSSASNSKLDVLDVESELVHDTQTQMTQVQRGEGENSVSKDRAHDEPDDLYSASVPYVSSGVAATPAGTDVASGEDAHAGANDLAADVTPQADDDDEDENMNVEVDGKATTYG